MRELKDGRIETACCACCGADESEFGKVVTDETLGIRMGELYPLTRWRKGSAVRRAVERNRQQNGYLVCGNCFFNVTDDLYR
jgi:hypothetical protein